MQAPLFRIDSGTWKRLRTRIFKYLSIGFCAAEGFDFFFPIDTFGPMNPHPSARWNSPGLGETFIQWSCDSWCFSYWFDWGVGWYKEAWDVTGGSISHICTNVVYSPSHGSTRSDSSFRVTVYIFPFTFRRGAATVSTIKFKFLARPPSSATRKPVVNIIRKFYFLAINLKWKLSGT